MGQVVTHGPKFPYIFFRWLWRDTHTAVMKDCCLDRACGTWVQWWWTKCSLDINTIMVSRWDAHTTGNHRVSFQHTLAKFGLLNKTHPMLLWEMSCKASSESKTGIDTFSPTFTFEVCWLERKTFFVTMAPVLVVWVMHCEHKWCHTSGAKVCLHGNSLDRQIYNFSHWHDNHTLRVLMAVSQVKVQLSKDCPHLSFLALSEALEKSFIQ